MQCFFRVLLISISSILVSCSDSSDKSPVSDPGQAFGQLVVPEAQSATLSRLMNKHKGTVQNRADEECNNVPDGYVPLANATVEFVDSVGAVVGSQVTTDACGEFTATVPEGTVTIQAIAEGYLPITTDVSVFVSDASSPGLASTISELATYRIAALQQVSDDRIAFTVTDSISNQAVLGLPASAFTITLDQAEVDISDLSVSSATEDAASTVMVMDASGSMTANAYTDPDTSERYDRYQVAAIAGHAFLDQKRASDETAAMIFSTNLFFMNQATIDAELPLINSTDDTISYLFSDDGFTNEASRMRFIVDAYNRRSEFYSTNGDPRHPDSPADVTVDSRYPFSGSTALFDAIGESVSILDQRNVVRPVIVALTDGRNNRSRRSLDELVAEAIAASVPVYTIGFGGGTAENNLTRIADQTGGSFFSAESLDLTSAYQSIQTGIVFQYICTLQQGGVDQAFTLGVNFDYNGLTANRELTLTN